MKRLIGLALLLACSMAIGQTNLPSLPAGTALTGDELILMQQPPTACNACTVTTTPTAILNFVEVALIPAQTGFAGCPLVTNGSSYTWNCTLGNLTTGNISAAAISMTSCTVDSATCSTATSANPSASIGLSAVNGTTGHWMDAGSAPALSQSISPTWTGNHTFNGSATFNGTAAFNSTFEVGSPTGGSCGNGCGNFAGLKVNGQPVSTVSYSFALAAANVYNNGSGSCSITSGGITSINVSGCTAPSVSATIMDFSTAFSAVPVCTVSPATSASTAYTAVIATTSTTEVEVYSSWDGPSLNVECVGP